jgi:hypothetical protein
MATALASKRWNVSVSACAVVGTAKPGSTDELVGVSVP